MYNMGMYIDMEEHTSLVLEHLHQCSACDLALEILDEVHQSKSSERLLGP